MAKAMKLPAGEACDEHCPVRRTAELVGYRWTTLIVRDLLSGKKRYSELLRSVSGISPRMLADRLRQLEAAGLLERTVFATIPPTTEYELTQLGRQLNQVIQAMACFGAALQAKDRETVAVAK